MESARRSALQASDSLLLERPLRATKWRLGPPVLVEEESLTNHFGHACRTVALEVSEWLALLSRRSRAHGATASCGLTKVEGRGP